MSLSGQQGKRGFRTEGGEHGGLTRHPQPSSANCNPGHRMPPRRCEHEPRIALRNAPPVSEQTAGEGQGGWEEAEAEAEANRPCPPVCEELVPVLLSVLLAEKF